MKKWLLILTASLLMAALGVYAEDKEALSQSAPVETPALLTNSDTPANESADVPPSPSRDSMTQAELQNLENKIEMTRETVLQLQRQILQMHYLVMGLLGAVVLMAVLLLMRRKKKPLAAVEELIPVAENDGRTIKIEDDTRGEYDFMGSSEGIPAKLDLARAYIAMEDFDAARQTLSEILGEGDETQRQEAHSLLKKMNRQ